MHSRSFSFSSQSFFQALLQSFLQCHSYLPTSRCQTDGSASTLLTSPSRTVAEYKIACRPSHAIWNAGTFVVFCTPRLLQLYLYDNLLSPTPALKCCLPEPPSKAPLFHSRRTVHFHRSLPYFAVRTLFESELVWQCSSHAFTIDSLSEQDRSLQILPIQTKNLT